MTALVNDANYGKTPAERLSKLENCGFLVKKEEIYDARMWGGGYEWATARGPQGIFIENAETGGFVCARQNGQSRAPPR